jgi:hypothetical protein
LRRLFLLLPREAEAQPTAHKTHCEHVNAYLADLPGKHTLDSFSDPYLVGPDFSSYTTADYTFSSFPLDELDRVRKALLLDRHY